MDIWDIKRRSVRVKLEQYWRVRWQKDSLVERKKLDSR